MKYYCKSCEKNFEFDGKLAFCPYCGENLEGVANVAQTIDSIWGETASLKREFSSLVFSALSTIEKEVFEKVKEIVITYGKQKMDIPNYETEMSTLSACETRKSVLAQAENLMQKIQKCVLGLSSESSIKEELIMLPTELLQTTIARLNSIAEILEVEAFTIENGVYRHELLKGKECFALFFEDLQTAYKKYIRCVNDNNMFAAFPSTSDFGNVGRGQHHYFYPYFDKEDDADKVADDTSIELLDYDDCLKNLRESNKLHYDGFLDEDFVPHVDGFWNGVRDLLGLLVENERTDIRLPKIVLDEKVKSKIRRKIAGKDFIVTEQKMELLQRIIGELKGENE